MSIRGTYTGRLPARAQKAEKPKRAVNPNPCTHCNLNPIHAHGLCTVCIKYEKRHGCKRPAILIERVSQRRLHAKWCKNCGKPGKRYRRMCKQCYDYWHRTGKMRPARFWDIDTVCEICAYPKKAARTRNNGRPAFYGTRCQACYNYLYKYNRERPQKLWGIGTFGWCDCGNPAEHQLHGNNLCNRCKDIK